MPVAVPDKKAILLTMRNPKRITDVFPRHQQIDEHNVAVPMRSESVQVLRNMGINVVGMEPIRYLYEYPRLRGQFDPMPHQRTMAEFMTVNPKCFVLSEQRCGKTGSVIWASDYLRREGTIGSVLVLSTMSTMRQVWKNDIFSIIPGASYAVAHGTAAKRKKVLSENYDYWIMNHDGIKHSFDQLLQMVLDRRITAIIVDEGAKFADHNTERYAALKALCDACHYVWWLTGTIAARGVDKVWGQCRIINPSLMPKSPTEWKYKVMWKAKTFRDPKTNQYKGEKWVPMEDAVDKIYNVLTPAIRFRKRDVFKDLPPIVQRQLDVGLSPQQKKMVSALTGKDSAVVLPDGSTIVATNPGVRLMKILQVCTGSVKDTEGNNHRVDCSPRMDELMDILDGTERKVIVFATFHAAVDLLVETIRKRCKVISVDGRVTGKAREAALDAFRFDEATRVGVFHPGTVSHGLDFSAADTIVWWGPHDKAEEVAQANERMASLAQRNPMAIYQLSGCYQEAQSYATVNEGLNLQDQLHRMFEDSKNDDGQD